MSQRRVSSGYRLLVAVLALPLLWLALQAGRAGIAGIYAASSRAFLQELTSNENPEEQQYLLAQGESRVALARAILPGHPEFALQAADFAAADRHMLSEPIGTSTLEQNTADTLLEALARAPVRADLWSRLASYRYEHDGVSEEMLHALDRSFHFGSREVATLLLNATITLNSGSRLDAERAQRSWAAVMAAQDIPQLNRQIWEMAVNAGMDRHLRRLIVEKERERAELERRAVEQGSAGPI